ncbi:MAG: penicillin-binding transpeptidase domain-containing protein [Solirubrobacteraceae bacterium]|jgi:penicillin-binding protein 2
MIERPAQRRAPLPPVLGRRVELLGVLVVVLFAIVVFRLWYLQILTGRQNVSLANANVARDIAIPAARGEILDRDGRVIANVHSAAIAAIVCDELPSAPARRVALYTRLAGVLKLPERQVAKTVGVCDSYAPVTIEADIPSAALIYLAEHKSSFPGVVEQQSDVRNYPYGSLAAQVLGYVGDLSQAEESDPEFKGVPAGNVVGQTGLEYQYDSYLRGADGAQQIQVNSLGVPTGKQSITKRPRAGDNLVTSLDLPLEQEGLHAMAVAMHLSHLNHYPGTAAAFIALDPDNGQVLALGSVPSFNPNVMSRPFISQSEYNAQSAGDAFLDRAIQSVYPTGSTFKPITALAGLAAGLITPSSLLGGTGSGGCLSISGQAFCNSDGADYGANDLDHALEVSEDTYFYELGALANAHGTLIQHVAKLLGLGHPTGIDLPGEVSGYVPSAQADARLDKAHLADYPAWTIGQNVQLATGQGQLQASPIQMAVAYSALANGGYVVTPHLGLAIDSPSGKLIEHLAAPARRAIPSYYDSYLSTILAGLHLAAQGASGTSDDVFGSFPRTVYGKTGTAQTVTGDPNDDQSWYVCYAPDAKRPIVVAVTVQQGGYGDQAAAPAARMILAKWFGLPESVVRGTGTTF